VGREPAAAGDRLVDDRKSPGHPANSRRC
jgi:hypothetical protein